MKFAVTLVNLKMFERIYREGTKFNEPFPDWIEKEIAFGSNTVKVVETPGAIAEQDSLPVPPDYKPEDIIKGVFEPPPGSDRYSESKRKYFSRKK
jgi:hypothetical protein